MRIKNLFLIMFLIVIAGCGPTLPEQSCREACDISHDCYWESRILEGEEQEFLECKVACWESCYAHLINKSKEC